jgi:hypothetical protein
LNARSASNLCGTTTMITSKVFTPPLSTSSYRISSSSTKDEKSSSSPVINTRNHISTNRSLISLAIKQQSPPMSLSVPMLLLPVTNEQSTCMMDNNKLMATQHIKKMKVIQSSSSSLSDFIIPTPTSTLQSTSKCTLLFTEKSRANVNYMLDQMNIHMKI